MMRVMARVISISLGIPGILAGSDNRIFQSKFSKKLREYGSTVKSKVVLIAW